MKKTIDASWVLVSKLEEQNSLFKNDDIAKEYLVRAYTCSCGHEEIVIGNEVYKNFICPKCKNDTFFNVAEISPDMQSFVENLYYNRQIKLKFNMTYDVGVYKNKVQARAKIKIPSSINFLEKEIIKEEVIVIGMPYEEELSEIEKSPFSSILKELQKLARNKELFEPFIDLKLSEKKRKREFKFVLDHYNLKDLEFMEWIDTSALTGSHYTIESALKKIANDKQFKSVKKVIFFNYEYQLKKMKEYNPVYINIVTKKIKDVNHVLSLLDPYAIYGYIKDSVILEYFFDFLLNRYSEKQLVDFFTNDESYGGSLDDILLMFSDLKYYLDITNEKVKCSNYQIHKQFTKLSRKLKYRRKKLNKFNYLYTQKLYLTSVGEYSVKLPLTNHELFTWADILDNCLASYEDRIENYFTTVYGFFIKSELIFAVEIRDNKIIQAYRKYNIQLNKNEKKVLDSWFNTIQKKIEEEDS